METKEGDIFKSVLNGKDYRIKKVVESMVVLESQEGQSQILTEVSTLKIFYMKKEDIKA